MFKIFKLLSTELRIKCVIFSLVAIAGAYITSLVPVYLGKVLDGFAVGAAALIYPILSFSVLFLLTEALSIFRRVSVDRMCASFEEDLRNRSIRQMLRLPLKELAEKGASGELTAKMNQSVAGASQLMKLFPNDVLPALFVGIFVVIQCIRQAPFIFALMMLAYIISTLSVSLLQIRSQKGIREKIILQKTKLDGEICQSVNLNGIEQIRVLNAEDAEVRRLAPQTMQIKLTEQRHHLFMGGFDSCKHLIKTVFFGGMLFTGIIMVSKGNMTGGGMVAVVLLFQQLMKPLDDWYRCLDEGSACSIKAAMLSEILSLSTDSAFNIPEYEFNFNQSGVEIDDYEVLSPKGDKTLSKGNNLCFRTGGSTALVARNAGGKSSLWKGIVRLYPIAGTLRLFGVDWRQISQKTLTRLIHIIPQYPNFFSGTVRDNIVYGLDTPPDDAALLTVLKKACIYNDLKAIEDNPLDVMIQEGGKNFSGGQQKKIAICRAYLREPKFFVLDESMANVDAESISKILSNFEEYANSIGASIIHIAHDQNVINRCKNIVNLQSA
jgi:ABC-type multidrug transport system fused ATPase/permease subunit